MCQDWDNKLKEIVIKNLQYDQNISVKPHQYELYLEGSKT